MNSKNIFLIDGASGTGKSDLVEYINSLNNNSGFLKKISTRQIRDYEKTNLQNIDLIFYSKKKFDSLDLEYLYEYENNWYGFSKLELESQIDKYSNLFIIIRNIPLMRKLKQEYQHFNIVTVFIHSDLSNIKKRMAKQKMNNKQIKLRLLRTENLYKDYVLNSSFYDNVIVNNSKIDDYHILIQSLINKYT